MVRSGTFVLLLSIATALRPRNPINITVYHVGLPNTTGISNMNSGDARGDAEFMVRAAGLGYLCSNASGEASATYDCSDAEQAGDHLVVTQFVIEAERIFSEYAECNIADGAYSCGCRNNSAPGYPVPSIPCSNPVGHIDVVNESSWGNQIPNMNNPWERSRWGCVLAVCVWLYALALCFGSVRSHLYRYCVFRLSDTRCVGSYRYYFYNAAQKLGGVWYSTLESGRCDRPDIEQSNCTWHVVSQVRRVAKSCQEGFVFDAVETAGSSCFEQCSADGKVHRNTTDGCWTGCFYDTALGPQSNATAYPAKNTSVGMSGEALVEAWVKGVESCPQV